MLSSQPWILYLYDECDISPLVIVQDINCIIAVKKRLDQTIPIAVERFDKVVRLAVDDIASKKFPYATIAFRDFIPKKSPQNASSIKCMLDEANNERYRKGMTAVAVIDMEELGSEDVLKVIRNVQRRRIMSVDKSVMMKPT
ncbi:MAG: hypothetical protein Q8Q39_02580 [bacterium]|nr:hypothetical protein [bacterium]